MNLRVCEGGHERIAPASLELIEALFAPAAAIADGTEIAMADETRWLAALVVHGPGASEAFLMSGDLGVDGVVSGRVDRAVALQRFRDFVLAAGEG